jgi:hypothetical protein
MEAEDCRIGQLSGKPRERIKQITLEAEGRTIRSPALLPRHSRRGFCPA